jgi:hypothetical protein
LGPLLARDERVPRNIMPTVLLIFATLGACSGAARTADPAAGTAARQQMVPAAKNGTAAAAAQDGVDLNLVKAGYSVLRRHDEIFYCRNEIITGNRISTRVCLTAAQIQDEKHDVTKAKDIMNQPSYACVGASCNN